MLIAGTAMVATAGGVAGFLRGRPLPYEPVPGLPGFRRVVRSAALTAPALATLGLGGERLNVPPDIRAAAEAEVAADVYVALHDPVDGVPVAFFTAAGCPLCAPQADALRTLVPSVALRPLAFFGATSDRAARAIIAADGGWALHDRLVGTAFRTEDPFIRAIAADSPGVSDPDALMAALDTPETSAALSRNHALAGRLGLPGTPTVVIGRTIAVGLTSRRDLLRILDDEQAVS